MLFNIADGSTHPQNLLDNSDFEHFVAQADVGGNHGTQAYAGDRWILDSGTVTGTGNVYSGFSGITLNGIIRQIVANPPAGQYACAVEMVSGTATIAYADGEVTITSAGGVLKNAGLYAGSRAPKYVPKGYTAELMECYRYYWYTGYTAASFNGYANGTTQARATLPLPVRMRKNPTLKFQNLSDLRVLPPGSSVTSVTTSIDGTLLYMSFATTGLTGGAVIAVKPNAGVEISADL